MRGAFILRGGLAGHSGAVSCWGGGLSSGAEAIARGVLECGRLYINEPRSYYLGY